MLPNEKAVKNIVLNYDEMKEVEAIGVMVTAKGHEADAVSRCFYPEAGIPEDPVMGPLIVILCLTGAKNRGRINYFAGSFRQEMGS